MLVKWNKQLLANTILIEIYSGVAQFPCMAFLLSDSNVQNLSMNLLLKRQKISYVQVAIRRCVQRDPADVSLDPLPRAPSSQCHMTEAHNSLAGWISGTAALQGFHGSPRQTPCTVHAAPFHVQMNPANNIITNKLQWWQWLLHCVSKKLCQLIFLLLLCQIWTDFNKNWKDCSRRNPSQNIAQNAHFT